MKRNILIAILCILANQEALAYECKPEKPLLIIISDISPDLPKDSFARKPKIIYRSGITQARVEESLDEKLNLQNLYVMNNQDAWIVNLVDKKGKHFVDRNPPFSVRMPIFIDSDPSFPADLFKELQFGCETGFFNSYNSPQKELKTESGTIYEQAVGANHWLAVLTRETPTGVPSHMFLLHDNKVVSTLQYNSFFELPKINPDLFKKPENVTFTEAN
ncbi:hypothetical protein [Andreprevotia chitinilytica]|uniref:hypothetical protein n=1 Tax=Andreprevotia chitinilytica TaxID=396808 RepID=UPI0012EC7345|nr:hypothetical protein [Andreprevotia chitinilytica]